MRKDSCPFLDTRGELRPWTWETTHWPVCYGLNDSMSTGDDSFSNKAPGWGEVAQSLLRPLDGRPATQHLPRTSRNPAIPILFHTPSRPSLANRKCSCHLGVRETLFCFFKPIFKHVWRSPTLISRIQWRAKQTKSLSPLCHKVTNFPPNLTRPKACSVCLEKLAWKPARSSQCITGPLVKRLSGKLLPLGSQILNFFAFGHPLLQKLNLLIDQRP